MDTTNPMYSKLAVTDENGDAPWGMQEYSFVLSILVQLGTLGLGFAAFASRSDIEKTSTIPEVLSLILTLETVVQCVELAWYLFVVTRWTSKTHTPVFYRYFDWAITTPVMLVSLYFFAIYLRTKCTPQDELTSVEGRVPAIVCIVVADLLMLFAGFIYESSVIQQTENLSEEQKKEIEAEKEYAWDWSNGVRRQLGCGFHGKGLLVAGTIFFVLAFLPVTIELSANDLKAPEEAVWAVVITFVVWLLYGVVAWLVTNPRNKNTAYNLLDIFSKNVAGIVVGIVYFNLKTWPVTCP